MNLQPPIRFEPPPTVRRAALAVHALADVDRQWMLAQLPPARRDLLVPLLEELQALGIPADPRMLDDVVHAVGADPAPAPAPARPERDDFTLQRQALARLDAARAAALLRGEPPGLVAQLLEIQRWPWREALLEQLGPVKKRRIEEAQEGLRRRLGSRPPEALQRVLVASLHRRAGVQALQIAGGAAGAAPVQRIAVRVGSAVSRGLQLLRGPRA